MSAESEKLIADRWKTTRDFGATTTSVSLVLFAALIVSFLGLWEQTPSARNALESALWNKKHQLIASDVDKEFVGREVRSFLTLRAEEMYSESRNLGLDKDKARKLTLRASDLLSLAQTASGDATLALNRLPTTDEKRPLLEAAIMQATELLRYQRSRALLKYKVSKFRAQKASFKLLGLDFTVDGFWAWVVWLLFFSADLLYLWLSRKAIHRRCGTIYTLSLNRGEEEPFDLSTLRDSLPIWVRPLPSAPWIGALANPLRVDAVYDPLSVLSIGLMHVCWLILTVGVVRMAVVANALISGPEGVTLQVVMHGAVFAALLAGDLSILLDWYLPQTTKKPTSSLLQPVMTRRMWMFSAVGVVVSSSLFFDPAKRWLFRWALDNKRHRQSPVAGGARKRRTKLQATGLPQGFYQDDRGLIHHVSASGKARSLARIEVSRIKPWVGAFDASTLRENVHASARVEFVRLGVEGLIGEYLYRKEWQERSALVETLQAKTRYKEAFSLVETAIEIDRYGRQVGGRMPNLQLYEWLGSLACSSQSGYLLDSAIAMLKEAQVQPQKAKSGRQSTHNLPSEERRTKTNRHAKPSASTSASAASAFAPTTSAQTSTGTLPPTSKKTAAIRLCRLSVRLARFKEDHFGNPSEVVAIRETPVGLSKIADRSAIVPPLAVAMRGSWNKGRLSPEVSNGTLRLRPKAKRERKNRIHHRKAVSCG